MSLIVLPDCDGLYQTGGCVNYFHNSFAAQEYIFGVKSGLKKAVVSIPFAISVADGPKALSAILQIRDAAVNIERMQAGIFEFGIKIRVALAHWFGGGQVEFRVRQQRIIRTTNREKFFGLLIMGQKFFVRERPFNKTTLRKVLAFKILRAQSLKGGGVEQC